MTPFHEWLADNDDISANNVGDAEKAWRGAIQHVRVKAAAYCDSALGSAGACMCGACELARDLGREVNPPE